MALINECEEYKKQVFGMRAAMNADGKEFKKFIRDIDVSIIKETTDKDAPVTRDSLRALSFMFRGK